MEEKVGLKVSPVATTVNLVVCHASYANSLTQLIPRSRIYQIMCSHAFHVSVSERSHNLFPQVHSILGQI